MKLRKSMRLSAAILPLLTLCAGISASSITETSQSLTLPTVIMSEGSIEREKLVSFLCAENMEIDSAFAEELCDIYIHESSVEGVNSDIAFSQMCLETGYLKFGGLVTPDMNNFCGLGATGPETRGEEFPDAITGIRAHVQHLKAYASTKELAQPLVDPRFYYINRGSSPTVFDLTGKWAADSDYSVKILSILERLYSAN